MAAIFFIHYWKTSAKKYLKALAAEGLYQSF